VDQKQDFRKYFTSDTLLLGVIILVGSILRFYNYSELPYSHDEFSALFRTRFDNFKDLIEYGVVKTDTHPAGIQVFMFIWVKIFGEGAMIVKLPFIIAGIATIYFSYHIGKTWFNSSVGLTAAMFISFLQYTITYSQYARPYSSGLFLAVLLVWIYHKTFIEQNERIGRYVTTYVLTGAACAYNHHFSLFFVGLVGITGIFLVRRKLILTYILSQILIFVLYIPHLKIFFAQLGKGGVESWLRKPSSRFFIDYLEYILHHSLLMYIAAVLIFITSLFFLSKTIKKSNKYRILLLFWILVTYFTAYYYSVYRSSVLQYSVLIFTFPFLVILIFSFFGNLKAIGKYIIVVVFGIVSIYTLAVNRDHFNIQYKSVFKEVFVETAEARHQLGADNVAAVTNFRQEIVDFYADDFRLDQNSILRFDTLTNRIKFRQQLIAQNTEYLAIGFVNIADLEFFAIAKEVYPYIVEKESYYTGDFYLLSKSPYQTENGNIPDDVVLKLEQNPKEMLEYMTANDYPMLWENERLRMPGWLGSTLFYQDSLKDIVEGRYNYLFISLEVEGAQPEFESQLICEVMLGDSILHKLDTDFYQFISSSEGSYKIHQGIKLIDKDFQYANETIRIFLWNKDEEYYFLNNFTIEVTKGNPRLYGLIQNIPK